MVTPTKVVAQPIRSTRPRMSAIQTRVRPESRPSIERLAMSVVYLLLMVSFCSRALSLSAGRVPGVASVFLLGGVVDELVIL